MEGNLWLFYGRPKGESLLMPLLVEALLCTTALVAAERNIMSFNRKQILWGLTSVYQFIGMIISVFKDSILEVWTYRTDTSILI